MYHKATIRQQLTSPSSLDYDHVYDSSFAIAREEQPEYQVTRSLMRLISELQMIMNIHHW